MIERDVPLGPFTTYGVGGPAALLARVPDEAALAALPATPELAGLARGDLPVLVVGRGSNLLVSDDGFPGLVVVLGEGFADIAIEGTTVRAGARALLPVVARQTAGAGLTGFEWAAGIPGTIGGAVRMNAGVHEADLSAVLVGIRVRDLRSGEASRVARDDLGLGYRSSALDPSWVVVEAELALQRGDAAAAKATIREKTQWRREHQPGGRNAGSVFTNPPGGSAGRLIDAAGLRGLRIGTAEVSTKHANFIQSDEGGRAADVWALMAEVRRRIRDETGIDLHPETILVGFDQP